jgi:hypothetical protein
MAKTWDFEIRQTGKAALAKIAKNEEVDTIDLKYALRELNEQYTEPPLHGSSLGAELRCTSNGWIASFGGSGYGVREIITQCSSAEEALQALVKEFDRWRDTLHRQEEPAPQCLVPERDVCPEGCCEPSNGR